MHKCLFKLGGGKVCSDTLPTETGIAMHVHLAHSIKLVIHIFALNAEVDLGWGLLACGSICVSCNKALLLNSSTKASLVKTLEFSSSTF